MARSSQYASEYGLQLYLFNVDRSKAVLRAIARILRVCRIDQHVHHDNAVSRTDPIPCYDVAARTIKDRRGILILINDLHHHEALAGVWQRDRHRTGVEIEHCERIQCVTIGTNYALVDNRRQPPAMSAVRSLLGEKRTSRGHPVLVAIDPFATLAVHCGNSFDADFGPYQSTLEPLRCCLLSLGLDMRRREFITLLGGAAVGWTLAARAHTNRVPRIGILSVNPVASIPIKAFLQGLRDLGYIEGQNVIVEYRYASGQADKLTASAAELVEAGVDVIFTNGSEATRSAQQATTGIPIVALSSNPVGLGFVASLARPEGNITGVSLMAPESSGKRLELLKEIVPGVVNVAVFWNPSDPGAAGSLKETVAAADAIGLKLQILATTDGNSFDAAFEDAVKQSAPAVVLLPAPLMGAHMQRIVDLALKYRLPTMYFASDLPKAGGLVSYGVNVVALFRRAAYYVDRILKGAKPADLPVEQPTKFELVINLKTAKALGLIVPPTLLARADEVIE